MKVLNLAKSKRPFRSAALLATLSGLLSQPVIAADNLLWSVTMDGRHDDNIGFAPDSESKRDTGTYTVSGSLTWLALQDTTRNISVSVTPYYKLVDSLEDLSNGGVILGLAAEQRFNESFTAPFVRTDVSVRWQSHENSEVRDGYVVDGDLALGKQFTPYIGASIGGRIRYQESTEDEPVGTILNKNSDEVYDLFSAGGFIKFDFNPFPKTALFVEYAYMTGDVAATGDALAFNNPDAFDSARDFAFEEGTDFLSWRIDADQHIYSVGLSQAITEKLELNANASYIDADGEFDNNYQNEVFSLGVTWTF